MAKSPNTDTTAQDEARKVVGPQGERLGRAAGPGNLNPGAGVEARRTGRPILCGRIVGEAFTFLDHPNSKDPTKTSTRFQGKFLFVQPDGSQSVHAEAYLPGVVGNGLRASLSRPGSGGVQIALEIWAEPDEFTKRKSAIGYEYAAYDRAPKAERDPVLMLGVAAGIIPAAALPAPSEAAADVDPETGEVIHPSARS